MNANSLFTSHERRFDSNRFVYPVLSRRAGGLSIGVNLNPDKVCNFDCVYCQVDRTSPGGSPFVELQALRAELEHGLRLALSGEIYDLPKFRDTPAHLRRLNDLALSGDGEPTTYRNFDEIVTICAEVKRALAPSIKIVLITNASMFHRPRVQRGLRLLDENQGEIWAKLDAGTADYFALVDRTSIPLTRILDNILQAARERPIVIQSLFMRIHGERPSSREIEAYCGRLNTITTGGGTIDHIQIHTVARAPAERFVSPLTDAEVDAIRDQVDVMTGLDARSYYSTAEKPDA